MLLVLGGITLYKTFALYEEKKEFNVLQGRIPDFRNSIGDVKIAAIVDGKLSSKIPTKEEGYAVEEIVCDKGAIGEWNEERWGIFVSNLTESETTCTITFDSLSNFRKLVQLIGSTAENVDQLLTNNEDIEKIIISEEAMKLIASSNNLKSQIKNNENYTTEVAKKFLSSTVISEEEKYNAGLPCYLYKNGKITSIIGGDFGYNMYYGGRESDRIFNKIQNNNTYYMVRAACQGTYITIFSKNKVSLEKYNNLEINYYGTSGGNNYGSLTGTTTFGIATDQEINSFLKSNSDTFGSTGKNSSININIEEYTDSYFIKCRVKHNGQTVYNTVESQIYTIALY